MFGKIVIKTNIKVLTGMHIGGNGAYSSIGTVDSPVITDARTGKPIIPGSSIKGKIRTLLANNMQESVKKPNQDCPEILRLFGSSEGNILRARLQFSDAFLTEEERKNGQKYTEVKFENTIDRQTLVANPRQIERVVSGCKFEEAIVYTYENKDDFNEDMDILIKGLKLLQLDYLGGGGTRGNGRICFENFHVDQFECGIAPKELESLKEKLEAVKKNALLSL